MPNCYQYFHNGSPVPLAELDDTICREVLGIQPDAAKFTPEFEFGVSFPVAMGRSLEELASGLPRPGSDWTPTPEAQRIARWLLDNGYTTSAWAEVGR